MEIYVDTQSAFHPNRPNQKFAFKGVAYGIIPPGHPILEMILKLDDPDNWIAVLDPTQDKSQMIPFNEMMIVPVNDFMSVALLN